MTVLFSLAQRALRRLRRDQGPGRPQRRLQDSRARRRRRSVVGLGLLGLALACVAVGIATARIAPPPATPVDHAGVTAVPPTPFLQNNWVLYGTVEDPRRVPAPDAIGCQPVAGLSIPPQPHDLTQYGSRVVEGESISALVVFSRSGEGASLRCSSASAHALLWLMPSSEAPPFTPTAITILGFLLLVAAALTHPATLDLPAGWRRARRSADSR